MQPIFSFKIRGTYNKIASLSPKQQKRGVLTASAGNHAQGVANACKRLKVPCFIVMPVTTPEIKVKSVKRFGSKVLLHGDNFDQASKKALQMAKEQKLEFIEAFEELIPHQYLVPDQCWNQDVEIIVCDALALLDDFFGLDNHRKTLVPPPDLTIRVRHAVV